MALRDLFVNMGINIDQRALIDAQNNVNRLVIRFNQLQRIAGFAASALGIGSFLQASDAYATMANRLKSVTDTNEEFVAAQRGVFRIARETALPVEEVTEAFQRYSTATKSLGLTQEETLDFTKRLTQAIKLGGGTTSESAGALVQFGQGLANNFKSGGQELNSLIEQAPKLAHMLAQAVGGPEATAHQLKAMAKQGKLTGAVIVKAVRNMGGELDKAFGKRALKFEDIKNLLGTELLALMKQLAPAVASVTSKLKDFVGWVREWVEKGEAMNSLIAAAIVGVLALSAAFGGLALRVAMVIAPWAALFVLVEDFVGFMNGADSLIGRGLDKLFGEGGAEKGKQTVLQIWDVVKKFFAFLADPTQANWEAFYNNAVPWVFKLAELFKTTMQSAVQALGVAIGNDPYLGTLIKGLQLVVGKPGTDKDMEAEQKERALVREAGTDPATGQRYTNTTNDSWVGGFLANVTGLADDIKVARFNAGQDEFGRPLNQDLPMFPAGLGPEPRLPGRYSEDIAVAPIAPQITNEITVYGNADAQTARQIGREASNGTASALGRDRSAIGAAVGMSP